MKFLKHSVLFLSFLVVAGSAIAQGQQMPSADAGDISDKELEKFVNVAQEVQKINQASQQKVISILAEEDMEMRRFQKIMMSKRNPKMADSVEVTEEEEKTIKEIEPKLMKIQQNSRKGMMTAIQENGLSPQRFQKISNALRTDSTLAKRFQEIAKDTMSN